MRTTVNLDPDVAAAIHEARRQRGEGISEALNSLARKGLAASAEAPSARRFVQKTEPLGTRMNIDNTADVLDLIDGDPR